MEIKNTLFSEFSEEQRFRQIWIWILLLLVTLVTITPFGEAIYQQLILNEPWGSHPLPDYLLIIIAVLSIMLVTGIDILFLIMKLKVEVKPDGSPLAD